MKTTEKLACSFAYWYPLFRRWSIRAVYEPCPDAVLDYLRHDGVVVPLEALPQSNSKNPLIDDVTESTLTDWTTGCDDDDAQELSYSFPDFSAKLREAIQRLGGSVFVKLDWSAPTDAAWIATNGSLRCTNLQDLYLLLKASDKISKDLDTSSRCYHLVLKEWQDVDPSSEFRCFVRHGQLVAVSQRHKFQYHEHLHQAKGRIVESIVAFFADHVQPSGFPLDNFIFDVVCDRTVVKIIDFNTFTDQTCDPCLFTWAELETMEFDAQLSPEFRYIGEDVGIQPGAIAKRFGVPSDLVDLPSDVSRSILDLLQSQCTVADGKVSS